MHVTVPAEQVHLRCIEESTRLEEIIEVVAKKGLCQPRDVKVSLMHMIPYKLCMVMVQCLAEATRTIAPNG